MNFNQDPNLASLGKAAKSVGVTMFPICRGCERNGQAIGVEDVASILLTNDVEEILRLETTMRKPCRICGCGTTRFYHDVSKNNGVIDRAFGVYFTRLNETVQTAMKGLASP